MILEAVSFSLLISDQRIHNRFVGLLEASMILQIVGFVLALFGCVCGDNLAYCGGPICDLRLVRGGFFVLLGIINVISCYLTMLDHAVNDHESGFTIAAIILQSLTGSFAVGVGTQQWCSIISERWLFPPPTYVRVQNE